MVSLARNGALLSVLRFGLLSWRIPTPTTSATVVSVHRRCGYLGVMIALQMAVVVEMVGVHLLVHHFIGAWLAWILTLLSLYGGVWLLADWNALRLRPILIDSETIHFRTGFRWEAEIPTSDIAKIVRLREPIAKIAKAGLDASVLGRPNLEIQLDHPVTVRGVYGLKRTVRTIRAQVDDLEPFQSWQDRIEAKTS